MNRGMEWMEREERKAGVRQRKFTASSPTVVSVPSEQHIFYFPAPLGMGMGATPQGCGQCGEIYAHERAPPCV